MATLFFFIATFALLVFVHEWGHFIAAKRRGIAVDEFGFGFPPRLFGRKWRGTLYSLNLIPLGGFVRIKGEEDANVEGGDSFAQRPIWERALVIVAGVLMNVVLGWALLTAGFTFGFPQPIDPSIPDAQVRSRSVYITTVLPDSPAARAGIREGDVVIRVGNAPITTVEMLQDSIRPHANEALDVTVERDDRAIDMTVTPTYLEEAEQTAIGVGLQEIGVVRYPVITAMKMGVITTGVVLREIVFSLGGFVRDLVVEQRVTVDLSGPVGIAVLTGQVAARGFAHLVQFAALLSLNLAVLNALPIPALDGGKLLFLAIEKIRRKRIPEHVENTVHRLGFVFLLLLVVLVTYRDVVKFFF